VNCTLAEKALSTAAQKKSPRAQTMLGAMYATGHCVNRDLPTAYHWFASALSLNPGNSRLRSDVEMIWRQMTPEEQQLASGKSNSQR
jgi:TPR repeat protein